MFMVARYCGVRESELKLDQTELGGCEGDGGHMMTLLKMPNAGGGW